MITTQQKMNDVSRFRAWHNPTKRMFDVYCFTDKNVFENTLDGVGTSPINPANIEDCVLEQCTGLKDKTGRLIYEGDIVKRHSKYSENEKDVVLQVEWNCKGARYITTDKKHDNWIFSMFDYEYEILGNIHENPELLEVHNGN